MKIIKVMLGKWKEKLFAVSYLLNLTQLGLPFIKKGRLWSMAKSRCKREFLSLCSLFNTILAESYAKREFCALQC